MRLPVNALLRGGSNRGSEAIMNASWGRRPDDVLAVAEYGIGEARIYSVRPFRRAALDLCALLVVTYRSGRSRRNLSRRTRLLAGPMVGASAASYFAGEWENLLLAIAASPWLRRHFQLARRKDRPPPHESSHRARRPESASVDYTWMTASASAPPQMARLSRGEFGSSFCCAVHARNRDWRFHGSRHEVGKAVARRT